MRRYLSSLTVRILILSTMATIGEAQRPHAHLTTTVFDGGHNGLVWVLNSDVLAYEALVVFQQLDRVMSGFGFHINWYLDGKPLGVGYDASEHSWSVTQRYERDGGWPALRAALAALEGTDRSRLIEFMSAMDATYGTPVPGRGGELRRWLNGESGACEELWPRYEDALRGWLGSADRDWYRPYGKVEATVEQWFTKQLADDRSVRAQMWRLLAVVWAKRGSQEPWRRLRTQNMMAFLLTLRAIERHGLVYGTPIGRESSGAKPKQSLVVDIGPEEVSQAEAYAAAVQKCLDQINSWTTPGVASVQDVSTHVRELERRMNRMRSCVAVCKLAIDRRGRPTAGELLLEPGDRLLLGLANWELTHLGLEGRQLDMSVRPWRPTVTPRPLESVSGALQWGGAAVAELDDRMFRLLSVPVVPTGSDKTLLELWGSIDSLKAR